MAKYQITKNSDNPAEVVFEKSNFNTEITLGDLDYNIAHNEKQRKEVGKQLDIYKATIKNVLETNPEVETMDEKQRIAVAIYYDNKKKAEMAEGFLKALDAQIEKDKKEMQDITEQTGVILIKINDVIQKNESSK